MSITHKILVSKETGKMIPPIYPLADGRPCPPDAEWIPILAGTPPHKLFITNEDVSHLNMDETYWDFEKATWVEVPTGPQLTLEYMKHIRDETLKNSDKIIITIEDPEELEGWKVYRQQLRDMFINIPEGADLTKIVWPKTPVDIKELELKGTGE